MLTHLFSLRNLAGLLLGLCLVPLASGTTFQELNAAFGIPLWSDDNLWGADSAATAERLGWPEESTTSTDSSYRKYSGPSDLVLGARAYSLALYGENGKVSRLSLMFANKGDTGGCDSLGDKPKTPSELQKREKLIADAVKKDAETISAKLTAVLGPPATDRYGQGSQIRETVQRWDWKGLSILLSAPRGQYAGLRIIPVEMANAQGRSRISNIELQARVLSKIEKRPNGDVVLKDIPMVDQGPKGYCVPATWERAMRFMAVPADMYVLAMAGHTTIGGGTSLDAIAEGARTAVISGGRRFDLEPGRVSVQTVRKHINHGLPLMWGMFSMKSVGDAMGERKDARSTMTDPTEWRKTLDPVRKAAKKIAIDRNRGHMCMIIGYNDKSGEIAVSDSWGPSYAERWMTEEEAAAVTQGHLMLITY